MFIKVDDREPKEIDELLITHKLIPVRVRMKEGDYVWKDRLIVERKKIDDFCGSIMDGRLKKQVENMERFEFRVVVIVGRLDERFSKIHIHSLLGMLSSMIVKGINVCFVGSDDEFGYLLRRLVERLELLN